MQNDLLEYVKHRCGQAVRDDSLPLLHFVTLQAFYPVALIVSYKFSISFHSF